jgi:hypothetical protein
MPRDCTDAGYFGGMNSPNMFWDPILTFMSGLEWNTTILTNPATQTHPTATRPHLTAEDRLTNYNADFHPRVPKPTRIDSSPAFMPSSLAIRDAPVATYVPKQTSAICETAVAGALALGLPAFLAPSAYSLCENALPSIKARGVLKGKQIVSDLVKRIETKLMTKNKKGNRNMNQRGVYTSGKAKQPQIAGMGRTTAPVAVSRPIRKNSKPKMSLTGDAMVIRHSEMIGSILSGAPTSNVTAFRAVSFRANPGISTVFPWLSSVAVNYEKYRFKYLRFVIVPLVATTYSGRIGVGFDYDSADAVCGNRQEFYALTTHAENMPWEASMIEVKCDKAYKFTGTHTAADNKLIDQGQVIVMSDTISNGGTISSAIALYDLIVEYEVELIEPQQALFATQSFVGATSFVVANHLGVGTDTTLISGPSVVEDISVTSASVITVLLPAGTYTFALHADWSAGAATIGITAPTTGSAIKVGTNGSTSYVIGVGVLTSQVECTLVLTVGTVAWNANLTKFNLMISRTTSAVYSNYIA